MGKQSGASLVETMVALFVLAIGLLGVLAMQVKGMQYNQAAYSYSQAVYLANDLAERVRSNMGLQGADLNQYVLAETQLEPITVPDEPLEAECNPCTVAQRAERDLLEWQRNVAGQLPGPSAAVKFEPGNPAAVPVPEPPRLVITVGFDDSRADGAIASTDTGRRQQYSLTLEI